MLRSHQHIRKPDRESTQSDSERRVGLALAMPYSKRCERGLEGGFADWYLSWEVHQAVRVHWGQLLLPLLGGSEYMVHLHPPLQNKSST